MKQDVFFKESCSVLRGGFDNVQYIKNTGRAVYVDGEQVIPSYEESPIRLVSGKGIKLKVDDENNIIISCPSKPYVGSKTVDISLNEEQTEYIVSIPDNAITSKQIDSLDISKLTQQESGNILVVNGGKISG